MAFDPNDFRDEPQPQRETRLPAPEDPRATDWYNFLIEIDEMVLGGGYQWAEDTLTDIRATVERTERLTDGQRRAIDNIKQGGERRTGRRRYEGFGR